MDREGEERHALRRSFQTTGRHVRRRRRGVPSGRLLLEYELHINIFFLQRIPRKGSSFFDLLASVADYEYEQEIIQLVT